MTGLSSFPTADRPAPTLTGMTTYAARHVALGGDDSEPEGLASQWGDGPPPRRAMMPEEAVTSYEPYAPEPELLPFNVVQRMDPVAPEPPFAPELGLPVVAPLPSQTPVWHIAVEPRSPLAPGPIDAATPVTVGPLTDPASFPTPVSNFAVVSYQSMPSPMPYASAPAQGTYAAPTASRYAAPVPSPYGAPDAAWLPENLAVAGATAVKVAVTVQRVISFIVVAVVLATFTAAGLTIGGQAWWIVGFAWAMGIVMIVGIVSPGRMRLRRSALK
jgi:hypothetical protein